MCVVSVYSVVLSLCFRFFFFQAEDGIRDLVRSRGLGDVYKRQGDGMSATDGNQSRPHFLRADAARQILWAAEDRLSVSYTHLTLPTSDLV